ncbi:hydroxyacylglutathione hydrolase [Limibaculum sp. FT325]|uniref:hydroxyacylglutathione hydrolase n=1 Tax=Thermohalobaculum sediminis TaxID=2939436 RepID=UPI0020C08B56|nr:hydroxyacylglutathione hydrolase [Limibaculum sediminis]MCL5777823.1 hydroxyacylglutathione hydrolase [Limibaculum sediminis]
MPVEIVTVPCRADNYAYLIRDTASGQVALVDAPDADPIEKALADRGWGLDQIWITHHHGDHTEAVERLRERHGATVVGNAADRARLPRLDRELSEGETVTLGKTVARVIDVSGHTIGHVAYVIDEVPAAFTADSLMALGCGRVFEGTMPMMWASLGKLMALPGETRIYSGHNYGAANGRFALTIEPGNAALKARIERIREADAADEPIVPVTLAEELETNPFLRAGLPEVKAALGMASASDAEAFAEIRRRKDRF